MAYDTPRRAQTRPNWAPGFRFREERLPKVDGAAVKVDRAATLVEGPHRAELLAEFIAEFTHLLADVTQDSCHHRHCDLRAAKLEGGKSLIHTRPI